MKIVCTWNKMWTVFICIFFFAFICLMIQFLKDMSQNLLWFSFSVFKIHVLFYTDEFVFHVVACNIDSLW